MEEMSILPAKRQYKKGRRKLKWLDDVLQDLKILKATV
jgi:hypothetical protein